MCFVRFLQNTFFLLPGVSIEVRTSPHGKGLFTTHDIAANTIVCTIDGTLLSFKETLLLGERESHCLQIDKNKYIMCNAPFVYSNHSCNPNCAINDALQLYTLKNIAAHAELLWDYSTSMMERHWTMQCKCGNKNCRKLITDFDLLPMQLQKDYIERNLILSFIKEQMLITEKKDKRRA